MYTKIWSTLLKIKDSNLTAAAFDIDYFNSLDEKLKPRFIKYVQLGIAISSSEVGVYACQPKTTGVRLFLTGYKANWGQEHIRTGD